ncbi:MAG: sterol desaturase family protein [Chryseolinea sp.]
MNNKTIDLWQVVLASSLRYVIFAGTAYVLFYIWKKRDWVRFKIQKQFPKSSHIQTELTYSFITILIFGVVIYSLLFSSARKYTRLYSDIHEHSLFYFFMSVILCILIHDTYFYWTHRLMHWRKIFPYVHHIHHKSHNPTPLAAFSFHPLEALVEVGVLPIIIFTIPIHSIAIALFGLYMILMNVMGHLGYELYPEAFMKNRWFRFGLNTSTHHNMHHHYGKGNYGLYFNIWDRIMKTNHARYEEEFISVTRKASALSEGNPSSKVVVHLEKSVVR